MEIITRDYTFSCLLEAWPIVILVSIFSRAAHTPHSTSSSPYCPLLSAGDSCAPVTLRQSGGSAHVWDSGDTVTAPATIVR